MSAKPVPTPEQRERLVTRIIDPSPVTEAADLLAMRLFRLAERWAGIDPDEWPSEPATWPWHSRLVSWVGLRVDDLGVWANGRRARRRLRRQAMATHPAGRER